MFSKPLQYLQNNGFEESLGKDKRGVPLYKGKWSVPPRWLIWLFALSGTLLIWGSVMRLQNPKPTDTVMDKAFRLLFKIPVGVGCLASSVVVGRTRRRMLRLATSRQASAQLQMDEATLQQSAEARNIKPFCNVNGVDFYDMADFGEAAVLLRASSAPAPIEELLRPAANSETPTELLLRPASSNDMPTAIVETSPNAESREEAARLHVGGE